MNGADVYFKGQHKNIANCKAYCAYDSISRAGAKHFCNAINWNPATGQCLPWICNPTPMPIPNIPIPGWEGFYME